MGKSLPAPQNGPDPPDIVGLKGLGLKTVNADGYGHADYDHPQAKPGIQLKIRHHLAPSPAARRYPVGDCTSCRSPGG